jgi:hypothetical protein
MKRLVGSLILAAALLVPTAVSASAASVSAANPQQGSGIIFACVLNNISQQNVRIVHENTNCKKNEHALAWEEYDFGENSIIQACVLQNVSQQNVRIISGQPEPKTVQPDKKPKLCAQNENLRQWEYDPDGDIYACVLSNNSQQNLRIVHEGTNCNNNEFALEWESVNPCSGPVNVLCVDARKS